jgi:hypothetical protein
MEKRGENSLWKTLWETCGQPVKSLVINILGAVRFSQPDRRVWFAPTGLSRQRAVAQRFFGTL